VPLAGMAWLIAGMLSVVGALPLVHLDSAHLVVITLVYLTSLLGTAFWLSWRSGLAPGAQNAEPYDGTPDGQWYGGLVYYNPADAAVLVPKRFGFGWTLNFARSASWIWLGATLLVVAGIVVLTLHR
jgi:uncharacterized membrane protein